MSYNPKRQRPNVTKHAKRMKAQASGGTTHAKAMRSQGVGTFAPTNQERIPTLHGIRSVAMECEHFKSYYECIYAGNNLGFGVNNTGHRTVRVVSGSLYLITAPAAALESGVEIDLKAKEIQKITEGSFVNLPAGTAYCLAAPGTLNVELLITESPGYDADWVECEEGAVKVGELPFQAPSAVLGGRGERVNSSRERDVVATRSSKRRQRQAQAQNGDRTPARLNANSAAVIGVNPMPAMMVEE